MDELIEELRKLAEWPDDYGPASINDIAERAAAALEAAREDAERYQWLRVNEQDRSDVFLACSFDDLDAAIDQARGIVPEAGQGAT